MHSGRERVVVVLLTHLLPKAVALQAQLPDLHASVLPLVPGDATGDRPAVTHAPLGHELLLSRRVIHAWPPGLSRPTDSSGPVA